MNRAPFDSSRLPREQLLAEAFPGQELRPDRNGWARLSCTHPACTHENGDRPPHGTPSLDVNVETGAFLCRSFNREGRGWKDLVTAWHGEGRWKQALKQAGYGKSEDRPRNLQERWDRLKPEAAWTVSLGVSPDLSARYLRSGCRYPGDPRSESAVALRDPQGELKGIKWRLPPGGRWKVGAAAQKDPTAKYVLTKGSDPSVVFLGELVLERPEATVLVCAGEKDALVAASHLGEEWAPVSGCYGEGKVPRGLAKLVEGRRVVIAYDGDRAGHEGAFRVAQTLRACNPTAARFPTDTPPGAKKAGWDVANVLEHQGAEALADLLEAAAPVPAEWEPKEAPPEPPREPETPVFDQAESEVESALSSWGETEGCVVEWTRRGRANKAHMVPVCCFRGIPRLTRVRSVWAEDPEDPSGWAQTQQSTYSFALQDGTKITRTCPAGVRSFEELLDTVELSRATEAVGRTARSKLFVWTLQQSRPEVLEERKAIGPHKGIGWIAPPSVVVRQGRIEDLGATAVPPLPMQEFTRYRLERLPQRRFEEVARWLAGPLLSCDYVDGAYTIPLLAAFMSPPLWSYVPELESWQRYAFWVQGQSGVGKSQLCRYFACLWGDFLDPRGLANWISSATWLEMLLHAAVSVPVFVSDFKRRSFSRDEYRAAMRLIQAYADRTSRGRAAYGGRSGDTTRPPRCTWIVDGEDLPEGEASTIGRMVVLRVAPGGELDLCADANSDALDPAMVRDLPGVTARWIAWAQRNVQRLGHELEGAVRDLTEELPAGASNRARLVRNYAVQVATIRGLCLFLEEEAGVQGLGHLAKRALDVHVELAAEQLGDVSDESAGAMWLQQLSVLLHAGAVFLRAEDTYATAAAFVNVPKEGNSQCVGTFDANGDAYVWPARAVPIVNASMTRGGGDRIEFSRKAIAQQLEAAGAKEKTVRRRVTDEGLSARPYAWQIPLSALSFKDSTDEERWP